MVPVTLKRPHCPRSARRPPPPQPRVNLSKWSGHGQPYQMAPPPVIQHTPAHKIQTGAGRHGSRSRDRHRADGKCRHGPPHCGPHNTHTEHRVSGEYPVSLGYSPKIGNSRSPVASAYRFLEPYTKAIMTSLCASILTDWAVVPRWGPPRTKNLCLWLIYLHTFTKVL